MSVPLPTVMMTSGSSSWGMMDSMRLFSECRPLASRTISLSAGTWTMPGRL